MLESQYLTAQVEIKLSEGAALPEYATPGAAGLDLRSNLAHSISLHPGETRKIPTGIAINIKHPNIVAKVYPRSGMGLKGLVMANGTGIIDSDYQGEIFVLAWNRTDALNGQPIEINPGDRIAQLIFEPVIRASFKEVAEFAEVTERGDGAFGSTGVK